MRLEHPPALLTADDERRLARSIEAGVLADDLLRRGERPIAASVEELAALVDEGRRAWQTFWMANVRLVWKLANIQAQRCGGNPDEFFQEGCIALAGALQRFDPDRGRFSTLAVSRIRQHLLEFAARGAGWGELTVSRAVLAQRARGVQARLEQELGRPAGPQDVAAVLGGSADRAAALLSHRRAAAIEAAGDDRLLSVMDPGPEQRLLRLQITDLLRRMPSDQAVVLRRRYGLDDDEPQSVAGVATAMRTSQSTVRRLEQRGLAHLRARLAYAQDESVAESAFSRRREPADPAPAADRGRVGVQLGSPG